MIFLVMFMTVWSINLQIMSMWQWRNVATLRFWRRHISRAMYSVSVYPILYKNRSPGKTKQDIHLIFSVFIYSNIVERINKVLKKIGNRPETAESATSPFRDFVFSGIFIQIKDGFILGITSLANTSVRVRSVHFLTFVLILAWTWYLHDCTLLWIWCLIVVNIFFFYYC